MGQASIFAGSKVKTLKSTLSLNGGADIISSTTNPQSSAVSVEPGSLLLNTTSGIMYRKLDAGSTTNWVEVGAGSGGKNYIKNPDFDGGATTSWSMQKVSLSSLVPTGNIGAADAGHTISASSSSPLEGTYSLLVDGASAFTAGNCLVSAAFAIDREDMAKVLGWSFAYEAVTSNMDFSGTSSGTWAVYIAEVTTGTPDTVVSWIQPAGVYNLVQGSGVGLASGTFQTTAAGTAYRIVLVCINSEAAVTTLKVDDFQLGPQKVLAGAAVSDWQSFIPGAISGFASAPTVNIAKSRRVGSNLEVQYRITLTGASNDFIRFPIPTGLTLDSSSVAACGSAVYFDISADRSYSGTCEQDSGNKIIIRGPDANGTAQAWNGSGNVPVATAATDYISITFSVPIVGWSSNTVMSQDTDTRVVAFTGSFVTPSIPTGTLDTAKIVIPNLSQDTHGAYNASTGAYTVPVSGFYRIIHENTLSLEVSRIFRVGYTINSTTNFTKIGILTNSGATFTITGNQACYGIEKLNAGDVIRFAVAHDNVSATSLTNDGRFQTYSIERLSGPATIAASETVACRFTDISGASFAGADTLFKYQTKDYDTHSAYSTTTGLYTIPVSGKYLIESFVTTASVTLTTGQALAINVYKNGSFFCELGNTKGNGSTSAYRVGGVDQINLLAGDTISFYVNTAGVATSGNTAAGQNRFSIVRVGN